MLGQMPQNGLRSHDSLYENMISMDLMELLRVAPEATRMKTFWGKKPSDWTPLMILANRSHKDMEEDMGRLACAMIRVMRVEDVAHRTYGSNMMAKCIFIWEF